MFIAMMRFMSAWWTLNAAAIVDANVHARMTRDVFKS
jgi:hypothetical protein